MLASCTTLVPIESDDEEFFIKCREIWNNITELIGANNLHDFVESYDDNEDEFIMLEMLENVRKKYKRY